MFRKIVSNLPFSPALVGQLGLYSKELNKEERIRRLGLFFLVLALIIQLIVILQPSESANSSAIKTSHSNSTPDNNSINRSLTASNASQGFVDAATVTAHPSNQISYTAKATNNSSSPYRTNLEISVADILDYATIIDSGGGTVDTATGLMSWPSVNLTPNTSQTRTFVAELFDTTPATAQGANNKQSFDCVLSSTFGNSIDIKIDCPDQKIIERIISKLPSTSSSIRLTFTSITLLAAVYFYIRSFQLRKEIRLIRKDSRTGTI